MFNFMQQYSHSLFFFNQLYNISVWCLNPIKGNLSYLLYKVIKKILLMTLVNALPKVTTHCLIQSQHIKLIFSNYSKNSSCP